VPGPPQSDAPLSTRSAHPLRAVAGFLSELHVHGHQLLDEPVYVNILQCWAEVRSAMPRVDSACFLSVLLERN